MASTASLTFLQTRFELRTLLRNRSALVFTAAFPIIFLLVFGLGASSGTTEFRGKTVDTIQFFVPGILAFGIISACYTNLAIRTVMLRDSGVLKRIKGTPLPRSAYLGGLIFSSVVMGVIVSIVTAIIALLAFNITFSVRDLPAALLALLVGSITFCAIALAVASVIPNSDGAPGIVNLLLFPILFISDVFYSVSDAPRWLGDIANFFPIRHFANAMQSAFNANAGSFGFSWTDIGVLAIWAVAGVLIAIRNFSWEAKRAR